MKDEGLTGQAYWRSLDELAGTPEFKEFLHREFPAGASAMVASAGRRQFLKIMGASLALAGLGLAGCRRWPKEEIVPFAKRPEERTPGAMMRYATSLELGGVATGVLATSYDGRPIKIEGNPDHPFSRGATDAFMQASVLDLYDPDRSRMVRRSGTDSDRASFVQWVERHFAGLRSKGGAGLAVLSEASESPSMLGMRKRMEAAFPQMGWHEWEAVSEDLARVGAVLAFGKPYRAHYAFEKADVIVSLDADFLGSHPAMVRYTRDFASTRRADGRGKAMSRLYAFESAVSLTGANADHRVALRSADVAVIAANLAERMLEEAPESVRALAAERAGFEMSLPAAELEALLGKVVEDLEGHRGKGIVMAGAAQPPEVHLLAYLLNERLGNSGRTVQYTPERDHPGHTASLRALVERMNAGAIDTLIVLGGNPVYDAPADLGFAEALKKVAHGVHLSLYEDETSVACEWHLPRAHWLECWGDGRAWDGTVTLAQPLIEPMFGGYSPIELLAAVLGEPVSSGRDIVRRTFEEMTGLSASESAWRRALHDGLLRGSAYTPETPRVRAGDLNRQVEGLLERRGGALSGGM